jgi:hypothetical protein
LYALYSFAYRRPARILPHQENTTRSMMPQVVGNSAKARVRHGGWRDGWSEDDKPVLRHEHKRQGTTNPQRPVTPTAPAWRWLRWWTLEGGTHCAHLLAPTIAQTRRHARTHARTALRVVDFRHLLHNRQLGLVVPAVESSGCFAGRRPGAHNGGQRTRFVITAVPSL